MAIKEKARSLRQKGFSYTEISSKLSVPKGTIASWSRELVLSPEAEKRLADRIADLLARARDRAAETNRNGKLRRKQDAANRVSHLQGQFKDADTRKLVLGALYLGEGTKGDRSGLTFGNSNPDIITLFLKLLRECFQIDDRKFRCTLQAREGQDIKSLEKFWSKVTNIPASQFYKARIDSRSKGLIDNANYKGVCRIDYLSVDLLYEVLAIGNMLTQKGL